MKRGLLIAVVLMIGVAGAAAAVYRFRASLVVRIDALIPWVICAQERDRDRAIAACTIVIDRGQREHLIDRVSAYYNRGIAYDAKGEADRAIADYGQAIALDPKNGGAYLNRGVVYQERGDLEHAIADYDQAVRIDPNDALALYNRGNARLQLHDEAAAIADFDAVIRLKPRFANPYYDRGSVHEHRGEFNQAKADFATYRKLRPSDPRGKAAEDRLGAKARTPKS